jgi:hypothetical protein
MNVPYTISIAEFVTGVVKNRLKIGNLTQPTRS